MLERSRTEPTSPRIGVALGGGSARGLVHIPFIEAMDELGLRPSVIAGTSIGALIGSGWAAGMSGRDIREHTIDALGSMRSITGRLWTTRFKSFRKLMEQGISAQMDAENVVNAFVPYGFPLTFEELRIPFYVIATDFRSWHQVVFHKGALESAIAGSIAIPSLFRPVVRGGRQLVDGGVVNPLPLDIASVKTDFTIGIDVNGDPRMVKDKGAPTPLEAGVGSAQIMLHQITAHMIAAYPPNVYIHPLTQPFGAYEFWRVREILADGDKSKERFKREVDAKIEAFIAAS